MSETLAALAKLTSDADIIASPDFAKFRDETSIVLPNQKMVSLSDEAIIELVRSTAAAMSKTKKNNEPEPINHVATCERCESPVNLAPYIEDVEKVLKYYQRDKFYRPRIQAVLDALMRNDLNAVGEAIYKVDDFCNVFGDLGCDRLLVFIGVAD